MIISICVFLGIENFSSYKLLNSLHFPIKSSKNFSGFFPRIFSSYSLNVILTFAIFGEFVLFTNIFLSFLKCILLVSLVLLLIFDSF